jgi:hypothetical protein
MTCRNAADREFLYKAGRISQVGACGVVNGVARGRRTATSSSPSSTSACSMRRPTPGPITDVEVRWNPRRT